MKKSDMLIEKTKEFIQEYEKLKIDLTLRQIYYLFVKNAIIPNNRSQYVYFDKVLTDYRKKNIEFDDYFVDDTRETFDKTSIDYPYWSFNQMWNDKIENIKTGYPKFTYNANLFQKEIPVILVEKNTLKRIFNKGINGFPSILIIARGFNSFSQMNDVRKIIENDDNQERKFFCYTFTDYDDSGMLIQDNFLKQMKEVFDVKFEKIERVALTKEQIIEYKIPQNPTKKTTHSRYDLEFYNELDAIKPEMLINMIYKCCRKHFDMKLYKQIQKTMEIRNRRLKIKYFKELRKIDLSTI